MKTFAVVVKDGIEAGPGFLRKGLVVEVRGAESFLTRIHSVKGDTCVMRNAYVCLNGCPESGPLKAVLEEYFKGVHPSGVDMAHLNKCRSHLEQVVKVVPKGLDNVKEEMRSALVLIEEFIRRGRWYAPEAEEYFLSHIGGAILEIMGYKE